VWGDLTTLDLGPIVSDREAVIQSASMVPPGTEQNPERAWAVNVGGTRRLLQACAQLPRAPLFVFVSSVPVFGPTQECEPPLRVDRPTHPVDTYSRTKLECERLVQGSELPWVVLRLGVAPPVRCSQLTKLRKSLETIFDIRADNRIEFIHPVDVGLALANSTQEVAAVRRVLLIGGGRHNRMQAIDLSNGLLKAVGVGSFSPEVFGREEMSADWVDSDEAQRILHFQTKTFQQYLMEVRSEMGLLVPLIRLFRPLIRWALIKRAHS
jgi:nucleoside-diphosphate-sugar epimerase